jgi:hypothetical protein
MTTGRINQVTILKPGVANGARLRAEEFLKSPVGCRLRPSWSVNQRGEPPLAGCRRLLSLATRSGHPVFPSQFPKDPAARDVQALRLQFRTWGPQEETSALRPPSVKRGWRRDGGSRCSVIRRGQRPVTHRTHPAALGANPQRLTETHVPRGVLPDETQGRGIGRKSL